MSLPTAPVQTKIAGLVTLEWKTWFNLICANVNSLLSRMTTAETGISTAEADIITNQTDIAAINTLLGPIVQVYHTTATIDFGSIAAYGVLTSDVALVGVVRDDNNPAHVHIQRSSSVTGLIFTGLVQADDNVRVRAQNTTNAAIDPASAVYSILVIDT